MSTNELIQRRAAMMQSRSGGIDWETIGRGMIDLTTPFVIDAEILPTFGSNYAYSYLFINRTNLKAIDFTGQRYIPERICQANGITTLNLPSTIIRIGNYAFYGCLSLMEIISEADTPPTMDRSAIQGCTSLAAIYVPDASVSAYQGASGWSTYASIIKPISQRPT